MTASVSWPAYVLSVLTPIVGFLAVIVGARLTTGSQESHWLKELRLKAYLEVDRCARLVLFRGADIGKSGPSVGVPDLQAQRAAMRDAIRELREAVTRVNLIADTGVREAAHNLLESLRAKSYLYFMENDHPNEEAPEVQAARDMLISFQEAAHADLRLTKGRLSLQRRESTPQSDESIGAEVEAELP